MSLSALDQLKKLTVVVADTGDFEQLEKYQPQDATTNPSLILSASQQPAYKHLIDEAVIFAKSHHNLSLENQLQMALDKVAVNFGCEILKIIPGRVSTEVDARLSFDTPSTLIKARELIDLYESQGIDRSRILIKIAATWEGLEAARVLEKEGIHVNMTLMFSLCQAQAAAEAGVTLISPFAGRITDYFKQKDGVASFPPDSDPGVVSVRNIYHYYKSYGYKTVVMGASFRTHQQVLALAGCDLLTVAPSLLEELKQLSDVTIDRKLESSTQSPIPKTILSEAEFRYRLNQDEMAEIKLGEGIRRFVVDVEKLESQIRALF